MNSNPASAARSPRSTPSRWRFDEELLPAPRGFRARDLLDRNLARLAYAILFSESDDLDRPEAARAYLRRDAR